MNNAPFQMLIACIGAGACWTLWFYFVKEYRVAAFRERLFSVRDQLFDFAANGQVSFDDPAYLELRALINGMLQFAHRVSFLTLLSSARSPSSIPESSNPYQRWKDSLIDLPPETKERLEQIHNQLVSAYMKQLVEGSIILFPIAMILLVGFSLRAQLKKFFSAQESEGATAKTAMVRDLARTLNAQVLEVEAYREGKASENMKLSLA
jgi:hypothetical protein